MFAILQTTPVMLKFDILTKMCICLILYKQRARDGSPNPSKISSSATAGQIGEVMNNNQNIPSHLLPIASLVDSVEVVGDVREKTDRDGNIRRSEHFNAPGWIVPVEIIRGTRQKHLPDGKTAEILDAFILNCTVWSAKKPAVKVGDYVEFDGLMIGAVEGNLYAQALGVSTPLDYVLEG